MKTIINKSPVDPYTLVHASAGVAARCYGLTFWQTLGAGFAWDYFIEPELKVARPGWFPHPSQDSAQHAFIDALTPAAAWVLTDWYLRWSGR